MAYDEQIQSVGRGYLINRVPQQSTGANILGDLARMASGALDKIGEKEKKDMARAKERMDLYNKFRDLGYDQDTAEQKVNELSKGSFLERILKRSKTQFEAPETDIRSRKAAAESLATRQAEADIAKTQAQTLAEKAKAEGGGFTPTQRRDQRIEKQNALATIQSGQYYNSTFGQMVPFSNIEEAKSYIRNKHKIDIKDPEIRNALKSHFYPEWRSDIQNAVDKMREQNIPDAQILEAMKKSGKVTVDNPDIYLKD